MWGGEKPPGGGGGGGKEACIGRVQTSSAVGDVIA